MGETCSKHIRKRRAYRVLVGNFNGRRPLGRPRLSWENNIDINLQIVGW
jgi:hypothetical protein